MTKKTLKFDAEVGKVLNLMIHSLYTNKDIFLRELISNASDACDKRRYLSVTDASLSSSDPFKITIKTDKDNKTITITDNGIGMSREELIENLGTIAKSGTQKFLSQLTGDKKQDTQLIGQFGVGFYSSFMVADEVTVISRKAGTAESWIWQSKGDGEFTIVKSEENIDFGTKITLYLKNDEEEYLDKFRIKHIVKTYSDHIAFPIEFTDDEGETTTLNSSSALWTRSKSEITDEQYKEFYKHIAHAGDEPWMILHNKNEGMVSFTNLLYIPSKKPFDLFHPDRKSRVKLYVKRVYITDEGVDLIPAYLRFLRGVVDSEDLPLNISRETLQNNHIIEKIRKSLKKKVVAELKKKAENSPEEYMAFWDNFGAVLKEGLCETMEGKEELLEVCRFRSALTDKLISLEEYKNNMKEGQENIFYISGESIEKLKSSPQLEGFLKRGIDVLLFTDSVDDFWVHSVFNYKDIELKSVTKENIDLSNIDDKNEDKEEEKEKEENNEELISFFKDTLKDLVKDVKLSGKLLSSAVCLVAPEGGMDFRMERFLIEQRQLNSASAKILEINPKHKIIKKIAANLNNDESRELVHILYDEACIIEGEPVADTGEFSKRLNKLLEMVATS